MYPYVTGRRINTLSAAIFASQCPVELPLAALIIAQLKRIRILYIGRETNLGDREGGGGMNVLISFVELNQETLIATGFFVIFLFPLFYSTYFYTTLHNSQYLSSIHSTYKYNTLLYAT